MSEIKFKANTDMFGCMAYIKTYFSEAVHQYKVIGRIQSNNYCDVPIKYNTEPYIHGELEDVLLVLHCGIAEDTKKIHRVALKDCERITHPAIQEIVERLEDAKVCIVDDYTEEYEDMVFLEEAIEIIEEVGGMNVY